MYREMFLYLKPTSRTVHNYPEEEQDDDYYNGSIDHVTLTVWSKSLLLSCKGFTVIASDGSLLYRVDNYSCNPDQIILMDGFGDPIYTICRRKKLGIVDNYWLVYDGEIGIKSSSSSSSKKPVFCVRKNISIMKTKPSGVVAHVSGEGCAYTIEGSYARRSCKIFDGARRVVSEIKKKEALIGGVSFGLEVFQLIVRPGIDSRFAMALVLSLDQMFS